MTDKDKALREAAEKYASTMMRDFATLAVADFKAGAAWVRENEVASLVVDNVRLERELAAARDELFNRSVHTCHDQCQRPTCALRRECDRLRILRRWWTL